MKITVTQEHIDRGVRGSGRHCPLAIAINEQCPAYEAFVAVGLRLTSVLDGTLTEIALPGIALHFAWRFDRGRIVRRWWNFGGLKYVFDIAIPESFVTPRLTRTSVFDARESVTASV